MQSALSSLPVAELGGIDDLFGSDSEGLPAGGAGRKRRQPAGAELGGGESGDELASGGEEEEDEEMSAEDDGLDDLLGSSGSEGEDGGSGEEEEDGSSGGGDGEGSGGKQGGSSNEDSLLAGQDSEEGEEEAEEGDADLLGSDEGEDGEEDEEEDEEAGAQQHKRQRQRQLGYGSSDEEEAEDDGEGSSSDDEEAGRQQAQQQPAAVGRYVPPAVRRAAEAAAGSGGGEAAARVERRVRGLLNRLAEANIQGIVRCGVAAGGWERWAPWTCKQRWRRLARASCCNLLVLCSAAGSASAALGVVLRDPVLNKCSVFAFAGSLPAVECGLGGGAARAPRCPHPQLTLPSLHRLCPRSPPICSDLAGLYESEGRRLVSDAVCGELIAAAAEGPRASDRFAAVTAAAVAGLAGSVRAAEVLANFLSR